MALLCCCCCCCSYYLLNKRVRLAQGWESAQSTVVAEMKVWLFAWTDHALDRNNHDGPVHFSSKLCYIQYVQRVLPWKLKNVVVKFGIICNKELRAAG